jgi:hypothetical protein
MDTTKYNANHSPSWLALLGLAGLSNDKLISNGLTMYVQRGNHALQSPVLLGFSSHLFNFPDHKTSLKVGT